MHTYFFHIIIFNKAPHIAKSTLVYFISRRIKLDSPILTKEDFSKIIHLDEKYHIKSDVVSICYDPEVESLEMALERIFKKADEKIEEGTKMKYFFQS